MSAEYAADWPPLDASTGLLLDVLGVLVNAELAAELAARQVEDAAIEALMRLGAPEPVEPGDPGEERDTRSLMSDFMVNSCTRSVIKDELVRRGADPDTLPALVWVRSEADR